MLWGLGVCLCPFAAKAERVLVLFEERGHTPAMVAFENGLKNGLWAYTSRDMISIFNEEMDLRRLDRAGYEADLKRALHAKYKSHPLDAVVGVGSRARSFLQEYGGDIFPEASIVFSGADRASFGELVDNGLAIPVPAEETLDRTLKLALTLQGEVERIILIGGRSDADNYIRSRFEALVRGFSDDIEMDYLDYHSVPSIEDRLHRSRKNEAVIFWDSNSNGVSRSRWKMDLLKHLSLVSNVPIYGINEEYLGMGLTGGCFVNYEALGGEVAGLVMRILGSFESENLSQPSGILYSYRFDVNELDRLGISEKALLAQGYDLGLRKNQSTNNQVLVWILLSAVLVLASLGLAFYRIRFQRRSALVSDQKVLPVAEAVLDRLPILVWVSDPNGEVHYLNRFWETVAGTDVSKGMGSRWESFIHAEDLADFQFEYRVAVEKAAEFSFECRLRSASGDFKWFSHSGLPVMNADGKVSHYVGLSEDVTTQHDLQIEVEESRKELAHLSRITMMGALSSAFAHELNQPLGSILVNAQSALRFLALDPPDLNEVNEILHDIVKEDQRAGEIISRTRHMLKKGDRMQTKFNVSQMLEEVSVLLKSELMHRGVRLSLQVEDESLEAYGDPLSLQQVLVNLVMNGCEAMEEYAKGKHRIVVKSRLKHPNELWLSVADSGPGISAKGREKLFEPFYTTKKKGLGLGLAICRSIAKDHGGKLWAENLISGGAVFTISIPIIPPDGASPVDLISEKGLVSGLTKRGHQLHGIRN